MKKKFLSGQFIAFLSLFLFLFKFSSFAEAAASLDLLGSMTNINSSIYFGLEPEGGDLNCDGYDDLVFTDRGGDRGGTDYGEVLVYFGGQSPNVAVDLVFTGEGSGQRFAHFDGGIALGDLNNDGCDDLVIGAQLNDVAASNAGRAYVFYGNSSLSGTIAAADADLIINGAGANSYFGAGLDINDFNGDGIKDLHASAFFETANGNLYIFLGGSSFDATADYVLTDSTYTPAQYLGAYFGSLDYDFNNDGNNDLIARGYVSLHHKVAVFLGPAADKTAVDIIFNPVADGDWLLRGSLAGADFNGDEITDFCLGACENDTAGTNFGAVYCFYGPLTESSYNASEADLTLYGHEEGEYFGRTPRNYDLNNDGYDELLIGAYEADGNDDGKVYIYQNSSTGLDASSAWITLNNNVEDELFGNAVLGFDWDNDGWANVYVAGPALTNGYVYEISHGSPSISLNSLSHTNDSTPILTGTATDTSVNVGKVQWSLGSSVTGTWTACTASDGSFNSTSEAFSCDVSELSEGSQTVYFRSSDANSVYMPSSSYASLTFTVDLDTPAAFDLTSPNHEEIVSASRPTFIWHPATTPDETSSISSYELEVQYQGGGGFIATSIPASQTSTYENNQFKVEYENFGDSDNANNYLHLTTKDSSQWGESNGILKEGTNTWMVTAIDQAANRRQESRIVYYLTNPNATPTPTPIPTPTPTLTSTATSAASLRRSQLETKITEEEQIRAKTEAERERIRKEGHTVQVKVVDEQGQPVINAKVELHSQSRIAYTNTQGIATFERVSPGEHTIKIAYANYQGEQKINIQGENIKEFHYTLQVEEKPFFTKPSTIFLILIPIIFLVALLIWFLKLKKRGG